MTYLSFIKHLRRVLIILISFFLTNSLIQAQILQNKVAQEMIRNCVDYTYNFQFENANQVIKKLDNLYPGHPVVYLLRGMVSFWENYPLTAFSKARTSYEQDMRNCIELCDKPHDKNNETEYLLANLCARGMLLLFFADNNLTDKVFPLATTTYRYIRKSFEYTSECSDFYFFTGLYNYYREAYPDAHPIYKALAFLFPKGDREKGLLEIKNASDFSLVLKAESSSFLSDIYINFENNYKMGYIISMQLHERYPHNVQYTAVYIKDLLLLKKYDEAEQLINTIGNSTGYGYFDSQLKIFKGIILEKKYHDFKQARQYYNKGAEEISLFDDYGNEFAAYAYFGLSRVTDDQKDTQLKKSYRKKALELASYKLVNFDE
jgi:hypothetical protein